MSVSVKFVLKDGAVLPVYKTKGAVGADICALLENDMVIQAGSFAMVPTGLFAELPDGYELQVRPRSGLAFKNGVTVLNSPGTIDSDYRGELKVLLVNLGKEPFLIKNGDRIAQIVVSPVIQGEFTVSDSISDTERGTGGFGSTGV